MSQGATTFFANSQSTSRSDTVVHLISTSSFIPHPSCFILHPYCPMNRHVISSGTIVCSAIMLYGWAQTSTAEPSNSDCGNHARATATPVPNQISETEKHCLKQASIAISLPNPEDLFNLQWGDRSPAKLPKNVEDLYNNLLQQAQTSASRDQFAEATTTLAGIPKNSRHYEIAQQLQADWSRELLRQATNQWQQAQVKTAISTLNAIPSTSQINDRKLELRQRWKQQAIALEQALAAKEVRNWQGAINALKALEGSPIYHSLTVQELLQQSMAKLYEPDQTFLQIATADLPTVQTPAVAAPEMIPMKVGK